MFREFKVVPSVPIFEVTIDGVVRRSDNGRIPAPWFDKDGYARVYATRDGIRYHVAVHRAVAEAWIGPSDLPVVNHKDGNVKNNHVDNLEWVTVRQNCQHAVDTGLLKPILGERHGRSKLKERDVLEIRNLYKAGVKRSELSKMFNVSVAMIRNIVLKINWVHI